MRSSDLLKYGFYVFFGIILSFILGTLSYYLIEQNCKFKRSNLFELARYVSVVLLVIGLASIIEALLKKYPVFRNKLKYDNSQLLINDSKYKDFFTQCFVDDNNENIDLSQECLYGNSPPSIIVMGDSHTAAVFVAVEAVNNIGGTILWEHSGCPIVGGFTFNNKRSKDCISFIKDKFDKLSSRYPKVPLLIANRYSLYQNAKEGESTYMYFGNVSNNSGVEYLKQYRKNYVNTLCELTKKRPVYLLKPIPEMDTDVVKTLAMQPLLMRKPVDITLPITKYYADYKFINSAMEEASTQCGVVLLDPVPYLCSDGKSCKGSIDGKSFYDDDNHLSKHGSVLLEPLFKKEIFDKNK